MSALLVLLGFWILAPVVFLIPPHIPWALTAITVGIFLSYRRWRGEYVVHSFQGVCPSCAAELTIKPEQLIELPHPTPCYACHQEPELQLAPGATVADDRLDSPR